MATLRRSSSRSKKLAKDKIRRSETPDDATISSAQKQVLFEYAATGVCREIRVLFIVCFATHSRNHLH